MYKEKWRSLENYEGLYEISNKGRVKSLSRILITSKGIKRRIRSRILKPHRFKNLYLKVGLNKLGSKKYFNIHRLVALHFIDNPENKEFVNHKDGNKLNNYANNLEWVTPSENTIHARKTNLLNSKGENNGSAKLIESDVLSIREKFKTGQHTKRTLSEIFNVHEATIGAIVLRKSWKHI